MRKTPLLLAALLLAGCSSVRTNVDYDRAADFSAYHTFAFKDVNTSQSPLSLRRVKGAIERTLASRGLSKADGKPDLWVALHTRTRNQTRVTTWDAGWGWGWRWRGPFWNTGHVYVEQIPIGTLMVDLVDTKAKELVWRGMASRVVDADETAKTRDEKVQEAIDKLFEGFPPRK